MMRRLGIWSSAFLLMPVLVAGGTAASPTASAVPPPLVVYDALGDSYASGYGVPPYGPCGRSASAYAVQLDGHRGGTERAGGGQRLPGAPRRNTAPTSRRPSPNRPP
jgi:hypothetical protein